MNERKIVDVACDDFYVDFYDVLEQKTPDEIIEAMQDFKREFGDRDIYFFINHYGYDGGKELTLRERRAETDKEYQKRMALEKKARDAKKAAKSSKEAKERAEYERLKKKFEDQSGVE